MKQRSPEWYEARRGKLTASDRLERALSRNRWAKLAEELRAEIEHGPVIVPPNAAMQWGIDHEEEVLAMVELVLDTDIERVGLIDHPELTYVACSPDGLGADCGFEVKCPYNPANHQHTLAHGMPGGHRVQVQAQLWITGRPRWYFVSYDPRHPDPAARLYLERIGRDEALHRKLDKAAREFWHYFTNLGAAHTGTLDHFPF